MKCPYCGTVNRDEAVFCAQCGKKLQDNHPINQEGYNTNIEEQETHKDPIESDTASYRQSDNDQDDVFDDSFGNTKLKISKVAIALIGILVIVTIIVFIIALLKPKSAPPSERSSTTTDTTDTTESSTEENDTAESKIDSSQDSFGEVKESTESDSPAMIAAGEGLRYAEKIEPLEYNGHVYGIFNFKDLGLETFDECEDYCERMGGHLAVIDSEEENKKVYKYLYDNDRDHTFIGFTDQRHEGLWEWVDYSDVVYTNWSKGQPNNRKGKEHYAQYDGKKGGTWNDAAFGSQSWRFLCEWEK